jgi:hypothetical protein
MITTQTDFAQGHARSSSSDSYPEEVEVGLRLVVAALDLLRISPVHLGSGRNVGGRAVLSRELRIPLLAQICVLACFAFLPQS